MNQTIPVSSANNECRRLSGVIERRDSHHFSLIGAASESYTAGDDAISSTFRCGGAAASMVQCRRNGSGNGAQEVVGKAAVHPGAE